MLMFTRTTLGAALVVAAGLMTGCASVVGDTKYDVRVTSTPPDASFEVVNKDGDIVQTGSTPSTVTLKSGRGYFKGQTYDLKFKKSGYADKVVTLDSSLSGWYWGNLLIGGVIGMLVVDPLTGAMYKLPEEGSTDLGDPVAQNSEQKTCSWY